MKKWGQLMTEKLPSLRQGLVYCTLVEEIEK